MSLKKLFATPESDARDWLTDKAFRDPKPGDRFAEMYSFWLYVVARNGEMVTTIEAGSPCEFPKDGTIKTQTIEAFRARFRYGGALPGYTMDLVDRGNNVSWFIPPVVSPADPRMNVDPCELEN